MPSLITTLRNSRIGLNQSKYILTSISNLEPQLQFAISEIVFIRSFYIFENSIAEVAYKLASGATYLNGKLPLLNTSARSQQGARSLMLTFDRIKPRQNLRWTRVRDINQSAGKVIVKSDPFFQKLLPYGNAINNMRRVRNFIAHKTSTSRSDFKDVILAEYGVRKKYGSGKYLLAKPVTGNLRNVDRYIQSIEILLNDVCSG
jgi:hypothetical protein